MFIIQRRFGAVWFIRLLHSSEPPDHPMMLGCIEERYLLFQRMLL